MWAYHNRWHADASLLTDWLQLAVCSSAALHGNCLDPVQTMIALSQSYSG